MFSQFRYFVLVSHPYTLLLLKILFGKSHFSRGSLCQLYVNFSVCLCVCLFFALASQSLSHSLINLLTHSHGHLFNCTLPHSFILSLPLSLSVSVSPSVSLTLACLSTYPPGFFLCVCMSPLVCLIIAFRVCLLQPAFHLLQ